MTYTLKREGPTHCLILDSEGKWIATVKTEGAPSRGKFILDALNAIPGPATGESQASDGALDAGAGSLVAGAKGAKP